MYWRIKKPRIDSAFSVGLLFLVLKTMASMSGIIYYTDSIDTALSVVATLFFVISILQKKHSINTFCAYVAIALLAIFTSYRVGSLFVLLVVITCLALRHEDIDNAILSVLWYETVWLVIHTVFALALMLAGEEMHIENSATIRYHFGFNHPNTFSLMMVNISVMWVWYHYDHIKMRSIVVILVIHAIFYRYTECRTAIITVFALLLLLILFRHNRKGKKVLQLLASICVPLLTLIMYCLMRLYIDKHPLAYAIDELLASRIKLGAYALHKYGLTFWGTPLEHGPIIWDSFWKLNDHTFDNVYSYLLCNYGIIWIFVLSAAFFALAKRGNERTNIMILLWAIYGVTEVHVLDPYKFFVIMLFAELWIGKRQQNVPINDQSI